MVNEKHKGFLLGAFLLVTLMIYSFWDEVVGSFSNSFGTFSDQFNAWIPKIITLVVIFLVAYIVYFILESILKKYFSFVDREKEFRSAKSILKYVIWILAIIAALSVAIGDLGVWLTSLGLVGFGVTFALQKPILNFVGWLTILFNGTYSLGDRIKVGDVRGDIIEIRMMYTVMDGLLPNTDELSGKIITIPNEMVLTGSITNFTFNGVYLWDELSIDITYESNWDKAEKLLKEVTFKVVNDYAKKTSNEKSASSETFIELLSHLKKSHKNATNISDKQFLAQKIENVKEQQQKVQEVHKKVNIDKRKEPIVRVELRDSSVGLNVRYCTL